MPNERLPSQKLREYEAHNRERYKDVPDLQDQAIATLLNLVLSDKGIAGLLDEMSSRIAAVEANR